MYLGAGYDGYGRLANLFFGHILGYMMIWGKRFDWSFRDICEGCLLRICNTEFHHKGSWVIGKWLKIKFWQSSPGNMPKESFKCLLWKQHYNIEKKHCSFSIPHSYKVTKITLSYNVAKTAKERSKGVSKQQTLQCQCIGGLRKYLKADVWVSFTFSKTIWIAFWVSFTFSKIMWTNVNMFPLFTFFNYETVPVYCLHSISTACLILVEKSKVLDAAAAQSLFIEKVFGVPTIQSRVN